MKRVNFITLSYYQTHVISIHILHGQFGVHTRYHSKLKAKTYSYIQPKEMRLGSLGK